MSAFYLCVSLIATVVVAFVWRADGEVANFCGIAGLCVSVIGFVLTIWTLIDTQRVNRETQEKASADIAESQRKAEEASKQSQEHIRQAQDQIKQMLEKVRQRSLEADCAALRSWLQTLRRVVMENQWPYALHLADECPVIAARLASADGLEAAERDSIQAGADDIRMLGDSIRKKRKDSQDASLPAAHTKKITTLLAVLDALHGRLFHAPTRGPSP